jgi:ABC-type transport system involved in multi-copper enzyme maturation permease subunit
MQARRFLPSLPLLGKELVEAAARRRTYALRCVLSALLLLVFAVAYASLGRALDPLGMLGRGRELCDVLFWSLFVAISLLQPSITSTTVTHEKERGTLVLLLLTPLRPWELVLQKWLSRIAAMLGLLLPALPLMAVAYAYGGFSADRIWIGGAVLLAAAAQLAAMCLAISCWCRGSTAAMFFGYLATAALYLGQPVLEAMHGSPFSEPDAQLCPGYAYAAADSGAADPILFFIGPAVTTLLFLLVARLTVSRRASMGGGNRLLRVFRALDGFYERAEARLVGRRVARDLPLDRPVAWREANRRSFANLRYLVRVFLPIYVLVVILCCGIGSGGNLRTDDFAHLYDALLGLVLLVSVVQGAGAVSGERAQQTLEVLLTTPLSARRIIAEKMDAMRRLRLAMAGALLLVACFGVCWGEEDRAMRFATQAAMAVLAPAMLANLALWIGLRSSTHLRAVVGAVLAALAWVVGLPLLIAAVLAILDMTGARDPATLALLASPLFYVYAGEWARMRDFIGEPWVVWSGACLFYVGLVYALRAACLRSADAQLRRRAEES